MSEEAGERCIKKQEQRSGGGGELSVVILLERERSGWQFVAVTLKRFFSSLFKTFPARHIIPLLIPFAVGLFCMSSCSL